MGHDKDECPAEHTHDRVGATTKARGHLATPKGMWIEAFSRNGANGVSVCLDHPTCCPATNVLAEV